MIKLPKKLNENSSQSLFLANNKKIKPLKQLKIINVVKYHVILNPIFCLFNFIQILHMF